MNLALFDLDHTLLPLDSDYEWGQFMVRQGAVDPVEFARINDDFYVQYQAGTLDPVSYLEFAFGTLSQFSPQQLEAWHAQYMEQVILPAIRPAARALVKKHQDDGDLVAIVTATNRFVTGPIAEAFGVQDLIAAEPALDVHGQITGLVLGTPPYGEGKVTNVRHWLSQRDLTLDSFPRSTFYSDSQNDIPLLSRVTHPVATNPNARLLAHAREHGWPILHLFDD
ncbi:MAG: family hydrolase [Herminiimonas sp.]|nr:family hydrolase [Herminiimonas sp.]